VLLRVGRRDSSFQVPSGVAASRGSSPSFRVISPTPVIARPEDRRARPLEFAELHARLHQPGQNVRIDAQVDDQPRFVEIQVFGFDADPRTQGAGATFAADDPAGAQGRSALAT